VLDVLPAADAVSARGDQLRRWVVTKVYKVTLLIVDHDGLGSDGITEVIEYTKYPNYCIYPTVMATAEREVEWTDDHPLNTSKQAEAFAELFGDES